MFGVKHRFAIESSGAIPGQEVLPNARPVELALTLINRAESLAPCTLQKEALSQIDDRVLLRRGKQPEGSKLEARMWLGPFKVISAAHPRYVFENAPRRKSRKPVHSRRLRRYQDRDEQHSNGEKNC